MYGDITEECKSHQPEYWRGPSYHQLRACLITDDGQVLKEETKAMIDWCIEQNWPTVAEIRAHRQGADLVSIEEKLWRKIVRDATAILLRAVPARLFGRFEACQNILDQDNKEKDYEIHAA